MGTDECATLTECFEELREAEFDAGWCEGIGILGGLEVDETPSIKECERIYNLTAEPAECAA
jgi:hypothetical protein